MSNEITGRCGDCKHFNRDDASILAERRDGGRDWGYCMRLSSNNYDDPKARLHFPKKPEEMKAKAFCFSEGVGGDFMCVSDFGCVEYEKRESETSNIEIKEINDNVSATIEDGIITKVTVKAMGK